MICSGVNPQGSDEILMTDEDFHTISNILKRETGISLAETKKQLVFSRLTKRLRKLKMSKFEEYCEKLQSEKGSDEIERFTRALTTNVTSFFREPHHFEFLKSNVLPKLSDKAHSGERIRIWSAGCSGGQEPYSIAMLLLNDFRQLDNSDIKILATDIDTNMIEKGKTGIYSEEEIDGVPAEIKMRFFTHIPQYGSWKASQDLREKITFKELNLIKDWPFRGKFDVIFCRNVVIYFDAGIQADLWERFSQLLTPGGILMIGHSERLSGPANSLFTNRGLTTYQLNLGNGNTL